MDTQNEFHAKQRLTPGKEPARMELPHEALEILARDQPNIFYPHQPIARWSA